MPEYNPEIFDTFLVAGDCLPKSMGDCPPPAVGIEILIDMTCMAGFYRTW